MYFKQLPIGGFDQNISYIIGDEKSQEVFLIDPDNREMLMKQITSDQLKIKGIVLTHGHFDHVGIAPKLSAELNIPVYLHFDDKYLLRQEIKNLHDLSLIKSLKVGSLEIKVIHTPGHAAGAVCLYAENKLITGDTVFVGRCGRTDIVGSNREKLNQSIQKIKKLPDHTEIYPGHDYGNTPFSTLGREKMENPFFQ